MNFIINQCVIFTFSFVVSGSTLKYPTRSNWNLSNTFAVLMPSSAKAVELIAIEF